MSYREENQRKRKVTAEMVKAIKNPGIGETTRILCSRWNISQPIISYIRRGYYDHLLENKA